MKKVLITTGSLDIALDHETKLKTITNINLAINLAKAYARHNYEVVLLTNADDDIASIATATYRAITISKYYDLKEFVEKIAALAATYKFDSVIHLAKSIKPQPQVNTEAYDLAVAEFTKAANTDQYIAETFAHTPVINYEVSTLTNIDELSGELAAKTSLSPYKASIIACPNIREAEHLIGYLTTSQDQATIALASTSDVIEHIRAY